MDAPSFDAKASTITIETEAVGMLAKLAHDLSITARSPKATLSVDGASASISLEVPVDGLAVDGVRKGGALDRSVLSSSDRADIEKKIRHDVLTSQAVVVTANVASLPKPLDQDGSQSLDAELQVEIGKAKSRVRAPVTVTVAGKTITAKGRAPIDLPRFGITPPKGPLGAFRVKDTVNVDFSLVFVAG
jgi:hypothetical protein